MRRLHFESLRPICPRCRAEQRGESPLELGSIAIEIDGDVREGVLHCSDTSCFLEFPIVDGIPLLFANARGWIADNLTYLTARDDLGQVTESLLGDAAGPGTVFDASRQHLSTYAWDHYGDLDPDGGPDETEQGRPGGAVRCLLRGLELLGRGAEAPAIDLGCAVGRTSFALAERCDGPVLGVDVNFSMLRVAQRVLTDGRVRYPRRRIGVVYDRRDFGVDLDAGRVDFWACDALAPPFADDTFAMAVALNLLDCVTSPRDLLESIGRVTRPEGAAILATPYDWSAGVTPFEGWIGGHSQRGPTGGSAEPFLRSLLTPGAHPQSSQRFRIAGEDADVPWHARVHERSTMRYRAHVVAAEIDG